MIKRLNTDVNPPQEEYVFGAKLVSINKKRKIKSKGPNETKFMSAVAEITNGDGTTQKADVFIWVPTYKEGKDTFKKGADIQLSTIADETSMHYRQCWIELNGGMRPDLSLVAGFAEAKAKVIAPKEVVVE